MALNLLNLLTVTGILYNISRILHTKTYFRNPSVSGKSSNSDFDELENEYFYFCLDCEVHTGKKDKCRHLHHPRIPLGIDITGTISPSKNPMLSLDTFDISAHLMETSHQNLEPIKDWVLPIRRQRMLRVQNIAYSREWGPRVRRCWKRMVLADEITVDDYQSPRSCLKCRAVINCASDMFIHLKSHLEK